MNSNLGFKNLVKRLSSKPIALDLETTSLEWWDGEIIGIALADDSNEWYVQVSEVPNWVGYLEDLLTSNLPRVFMHNAKFDIHWLRNHLPDIRLPEVWDTMGLAHMANENTPLNLKKLSWIYLDRTPLEWDDSNYGDLERMAVYAAADARNTYDLAVYLGKLLKKNKLLELYKVYGHAMPLIAQKMERRGYYLNMNCILDDREYLQEYVNYLVNTLISLGPGLENLNSYQQRSRALDALGFEGKKEWKTKAGFWSTREENIIKMLQEYKSGIIHDFLFLFSKYQAANKLLSFISNSNHGGLLELQYNKVIHPNWMPFATVTWRWACSKPNLQQMPRPTIVGEGTKWERKINPRKWFTASPGMVFGAADLSQAELRYMAAMAQERKLIDAYNEGADIHTLVASDIFGVTYDKVEKQQRHTAKQVNYAEAYGAGPKRLSTDPRLLPYLTEKECREILAKKAAAFPRLEEWKAGTKENARIYGEVRTAFGVPRRPTLVRLDAIYGISDPSQVPAGPDRAAVVAFQKELKKVGYTTDTPYNVMRWLRGRGERQAVNAPMQGSVAQHMSIAMQKADQLGVKLMGQVHDEIHFEAAPDRIEEACEIIEDSLNINYGGVNISGEANHGKTWADAK